MSRIGSQPAVTVGFGLYTTIPMVIGGLLLSIFGASGTVTPWMVYIGVSVLSAAVLTFGVSMYALGFQAHERAAGQPILDELSVYVRKQVAYEVNQTKKDIKIWVRDLLDE